MRGPAAGNARMAEPPCFCGTLLTCSFPRLRNVLPGHRVEPTVRRIILTLLTLAVLLPSAAFAGARYLCAMDGQVRSACCCPAKAHKHERDVESQSVMRSNCCCKVSTVAPTTPPETIAASTQVDTATPPVAVPVPFITMPPRERFVIAHAIDTRPPKPDRTLFVRHCAFLL